MAGPYMGADEINSRIREIELRLMVASGEEAKALREEKAALVRQLGIFKGIKDAF